MPTERELRELLCEIGRRVWTREYVAANDGNFSVRLSPTEVLCTPTLVSKGFMQPEELAVVSPEDGRLLRGPLRATSEIKMHLEIYRQRPDVQAVVHAHPPHATAFALVGRPMPKCVLPETEVLLGDIPVVPYETPGTHAFAEALKPFLATCDAFLLSSHGAVTAGRDPLEAYHRLETLDQYCKILILTRQLGDVNQIPASKVRELLDIRTRLGFREIRVGLTDEALCRAGVEGEAVPCSGQALAEKQLVEQIVREVISRLS